MDGLKTFLNLMYELGGRMLTIKDIKVGVS